MREIAFSIMGEPKPLKRHRDRKPVFAGDRYYTPKYDPSAKAKDSFLAIAHRNRPERPIDTPMKLKLTFCFARPKKHYRTGRFVNRLKPNAPKYHASTPDTDNLIKFVADSLNGVFWKDDSLICIIHAEKIYSENPCTEIHIVY